MDIPFIVEPDLSLQFCFIFTVSWTNIKSNMYSDVAD